jgi:SAM-dependent methyltransferase
MSEGRGPNAETIEAWNTIRFDKWLRFRHITTEGLAGHGEVAIERAAPPAGARVVDLGCGFGDTALALARRVGASGEVVGIDASTRFIELATNEARAGGVENARFAVKDVQCDDLGGPYDLAFSRFGMMFFADPAQALQNVRSSLRAGGKLCIVVWRRLEDNDWLQVPARVVRAFLPDKEEKPAAPPGGPGPFSMASADVTSAELRRAGFDRVTFERHDEPILIGRDLDDATDCALTLGPAGEIVRLAGEEGVRRRPEIARALRAELTRFVSDDPSTAGSVRAPSSTWIVSAVRD